MPTSLTTRVIDHLRRAVLPRDGVGLGDGELLGAFIDRRDEAAIAALITRHGPMVWGVCRRLLNHHDAEDAFQATFLVLVRKAASIAPREMVGNWLYGVAHQTALQARRAAARRRTREVQVTEMPDTATSQQDLWADVQPLLDEELSRLPDIYRAVIVLCDLEGRTRNEVARQLGCPEGTVGGRLARARALLAKRLARRGVTLSGGALAMVLAHNVASAGVPTSVVSNTIRAASLFAAGPTAAAGVISPTVATLTEGALQAMRMSKLKVVVAVAVVLGALAAGATVLTSHTAAAQGDNPPVVKEPVKSPPKDKTASTPPVKEVGDLEGEWVVVAMEGDGEKASADELKGMKWVVKGNEITASQPGLTGKMSFKLNPGKTPNEIDITSRDGNLKGTTSPGIYAIEGQRLRVCFGEKVRPKTFATAAGDGRTMLTLEKEPFTAWGKEINGLQAGLGYLPGEKRAYKHGETVTVVARVRNVGKEAVEFKHIWAFFVENAPTITDADGKPVQLPRVLAEGLQLPRNTPVPPGKEVELYEWKFDLRPKGEGSTREWSTIHGTGQFSLQCERIVGPTSANPEHPNPALGKLATGKLELEVKDAKKLPEKPDQEKEPFTTWGKEVDGVQAGLGYLPGAKRTYAPGESAKLVVRVRNAGKKDVKLSYFNESFYENPPTVTDSAGKRVPLEGVGLSGLARLVEVNLAPGKDIDLCELNLALRPASEKDKVRPWSLYETGKFQLQFERLGGNIGTGEIKFDPVLSKLVTGKLELEVKSDPPSGAAEKK